MTLVPRIVVVTRPTEYEELLARHATRSQAEFFLRQRGQSLDDCVLRHERTKAALAQVQSAIPLDYRRNTVLRGELSRFRFEPEDTVVVVGQDGLVANVAKYLEGQPVIGVNPMPDVFDGVLVTHDPAGGARALVRASRRATTVVARTMVEVSLDDGQSLLALNEVFVGARTHQSARYRVEANGHSAVHSSSGVIVTTGTGSTGWARSIHRERASRIALPHPDERSLAFFAREVFPSIATSTELAEGRIADGESLRVTSRMDGGVIFGDGMEDDRIAFDWGMRATVRVAGRALRLVSAA